MKALNTHISATSNNATSNSALRSAIDRFACRWSAVGLLFAVIVHSTTGCGRRDNADVPSAAATASSNASSTNGLNPASKQSHARSENDPETANSNPAKPQPPAELPALVCSLWLNEESWHNGTWSSSHQEASIVNSTPNAGESSPGEMHADKTRSPGQVAGQTTGRVTVIDVFATDCVPCHREMPRFTQVALRYRPSGVQFVSLAAIVKPKDATEIERFALEYDITWPVGCCPPELLETLAVSEYPTILVYDAQGAFVWWSQQPGTVEQAIEKALAATATSAAPVVAPNAPSVVIPPPHLELSPTEATSGS